MAFKSGLEVLGAVSATVTLLEVSIHIIRRVRKAQDEQKDLARTLSSHQDELMDIQDIVRSVKEEKALQTTTVASHLDRIKAVAERLVDCLKKLDPGEKSSMRQFAHQMVQGSRDVKLLDGIMNELSHAKASLSLRVQIANVGLTRVVGDALVTNAGSISRINSAVTQAFDTGRESIFGNAGTTSSLQPSFFKTSEYESYKDVNPARVHNTCAWFLDHPAFRSWKASSTDDLLWLSANPGCGKSVLSRALIDEKLVGTEPFTLCYFFFKDNDKQNNTATAFCALLHQFFCFRKDLLQKHVGVAVEHCGEALKADSQKLWQVFLSAAKDPSVGNVICILDALDECHQHDRDKLIANLELFYTGPSEAKNRDSRLKFLVTSRPYREIELRFSKLTRSIPAVRLAGEEESHNISREIGSVIKNRVKDIAERRGLKDEVRFALEDRLCRIPHTTHLWLHLVLDQVEQGIGKTEKKILEIINTMPHTVEEAYEKILSKCDHKNAKRVLQIILAAERPLTLSEIDIALEIDLSCQSCEDLDLEGNRDRKEWIRGSCGLFVTIVDSYVYLIHQTAKEFLLQKIPGVLSSQGWQNSINLKEAHGILAQKCVAYLTFREFQPCNDLAQIHESPDENQDEILWELMQNFAFDYKFLDYSATTGHLMFGMLISIVMRSLKRLQHSVISAMDILPFGSTNATSQDRLAVAALVILQIDMHYIGPQTLDF